MATINGGRKLAAALAAVATSANGATKVRIGFLENARYSDGTLVAMIAAINEFGAPRAGIPPRPFFRNMIAAKSSSWPQAIADLLAHNNFDARVTLAQAGEGIKGQLQQSIVDTNTPPNAPSTIARKGSAKPLVDTGHMLNSIDYEVE